MLHVTTSVGVPGRKEREKRHFPLLSNAPSELNCHKDRGRTYIPHGYGIQPEFKPHPPHIEPRYTEAGPDWSSRLRYIPSPKNEDYPAPENWPEPWKSMRCFPWMNKRTDKEWMLYPVEGKDATLRTKWAGVHFASSYSAQELSDKMRFGKGRHEFMINKRNGIGMASPGDKSYQAPEYSTNFHKVGSTRPLPNFSGGVKKATDTFVPLQDLPTIPVESYQSKEKKNRLQEEVNNVEELDDWRPATPLDVQTAKLGEVFQEHKPRGKWRHGQYYIINPP